MSGRLSLSKIGDIKIKLHRPVKGEIKTLTLKRENSMWYACFSCVVEPEPLPANDKAVGLDVGLLSFVTRNDGLGIGNARWFQKVQKRLRRAQRRVARREKFSKRWKKAVRLVAKIHRKVFNQRSDTMQDGRHSFKNFRTRPKAPGESSRPSIPVGPASVARVEHQIPNGFQIVSMFASSADW